MTSAQNVSLATRPFFSKCISLVENYSVSKKAISCYKLANQQIKESATVIRPRNIPGYFCKYFKLCLQIST